MSKPITVEIFAIGCELSGAGCPRQAGGCGGCSRLAASPHPDAGASRTTGGCGACGGCCRDKPTSAVRTVGGLYRDLEKQLRQNGLVKVTDLRFIDLFDTPIEFYPAAQRLVAAGYTPPLILINGDLRYYGGIDPAVILAAIQAAAESRDEGIPAGPPSDPAKGPAGVRRDPGSPTAAALRRQRSPQRSKD